jgi:hypothetical protein
MEKALKLNGTEDSPEVVLDQENNVFVLSGRSLPEDAMEFYKPIFSWIRSYLKDPNPNTELHIKLQYFNSSSVKQILDLILLLEELIKAGKKAKVVWFYDDGDELIEMKGQEFKSIVSIPFELKIN